MIKKLMVFSGVFLVIAKNSFIFAVPYRSNSELYRNPQSILNSKKKFVSLASTYQNKVLYKPVEQGLPHKIIQLCKLLLVVSVRVRL